MDADLTGFEFCGFPRDFQGFLFELRFINTIQNQAENLEKYKKIISEPLRLLYEALVPAVPEMNGELETRPSRCVSSPYTDRRFSRGVPLKEYMYIRFKQHGKPEDVPGLYFDMGSDYYSYGLRIYNQSSRGVDILREKIAANLALYSDELNIVQNNGFSVFGNEYKKDRYAELPECPAKVLLNRKHFYIGKDIPVREAVFSHMLAEEIADGFSRMKGLLNLIMK